MMTIFFFLGSLFQFIFLVFIFTHYFSRFVCMNMIDEDKNIEDDEKEKN